MLFSPRQDTAFKRQANTTHRADHATQARELASTLYNVQHFTGGNAFLPKSSNWARVALFISTYINNVLNTGDHRLAGNPHPDSPVWRMAMEYAQKQARGFKDVENKGSHAYHSRPKTPANDRERMESTDPGSIDILDELDSLADEVQG
tara:strand:- start:3939 stop:4385 length:447 start_codon:yes stop_codon:yes gene_type:complete